MPTAEGKKKRELPGSRLGHDSVSPSPSPTVDLDTAFTNEHSARTPVNFHDVILQGVFYAFERRRV